MPKLTVDGIEVEVPQGATVMQACEAAGAEIPRFCYHERLSIAGNCRMCLVEVTPGPPKPQASCALPAADGQVVSTRSAKTQKAREGVMEFLLINHPLDCPICDQGGECDLQDQSLAYGKGHSRYHENKRAVTEKFMGPLIKTVMTRCIHCTRCVRFAEEVAGVEEIGAIGRGENMQITSYLEGAVRSELSGNVIDLCPVGALTSKPYAFEARPWELKRTESIDVMDAVGTNITVHTRGAAVMRVTPRVNDDVNEEWASDVTRFAVDGLQRGRLDAPYVRVGGKLTRATWGRAFDAVKAALTAVAGDDIAAVAGDLADVEAMVALKDLLGTLGSTRHECRVDGAAVSAAGRSHYLFNSGLAGIERADVILLVGTDPRHEAPLVNTRVRKAVRKGGARVFSIGPDVDLTYPVTCLGDDAALLADLPAALVEALGAAERPAVIVGMGALGGAGGGGVHAAVAALVAQHRFIRDDLERGQRPPHGGEPGRRARYRLRDRRGHGGASPLRRRRCCSTSASTRSTCRARFRSTSAITATAACGRPTSSCPPLPIPRRAAPTLTSRAGCSGPRARPSRRARRARTGRSSVRCRPCSGRRCRMTICARCGPASPLTGRIWRARG